MAIPQSMKRDVTPEPTVHIWQCVYRQFFTQLLALCLLLCKPVFLTINMTKKSVSTIIWYVTSLHWATVTLFFIWIIVFIAHQLQHCPGVIFLEKLFGAPTPLPGLIVGVLSDRDHFLQRLAVRNTWAMETAAHNNLLPTRLVFVVGGLECDVPLSLRDDARFCSSRDDQQDYAMEWLSSNYQLPSSWQHSETGQCVVGLGLTANTDVILSRLTMTVPDQMLFTEQPRVWLNYGDTRNTTDPLDLEKVLDYWNIDNVNYLLPKGVQVEVVLELDKEDCFQLDVDKECVWSSGAGSVQYTFVRYSDGSVAPWTDRHCPMLSMAMENAAELCPKDWKLFDGHCYYFSGVSDKRSWQDAQAACAGADSTLTSVTSERENTFLYRSRRSDRHVWLGLHSEQSLATFKWVDGTALLYTKWDDYEPNNNNGRELCVEMGSRTSTWNDNYCDIVHNFVCKRKRMHRGGQKALERQAAEALLTSRWISSRSSVERRLEEEQRQFSDLLMLPYMVDTYSSLPSKLKMLLAWTDTAYPGHWLLKTDDDAHVNLTVIADIIRKATITETATDSEDNAHYQCTDGPDCSSWSLLESILSVVTPTWGRSSSDGWSYYYPPEPAVYSHFHRLSSVNRFGKSAEYEYTGLSYPQFPSGSGYLMTGSVVSGLAKVGDLLREYGGEDTSMGVWLAALTFDPFSHYPVGIREISLAAQEYTVSLIHSATADMSTLFERLFLAQPATPRSEKVAAPIPNTYDATRNKHANLVTVPCWIKGTHGCDNYAVAPDLSIDEMDGVHRGGR